MAKSNTPDVGKMKSGKDIDGLIAVMRDATLIRNIRRDAALALQFLYLAGSLEEAPKEKIRKVEWLVTKMVENIDEKKRKALERAKEWWSGKPDPAGADTSFVCDVCNGEIRQKEGTSFLGSYMRCARCTVNLFERWDKGED